MISPRRRSCLGVCVGLLLLCAACTGARRPPQNAFSISRPLNGYRALCLATWSEAGKKQRLRLAVAFENPSRLRLEILDSFGSSRGVLVTRQEGALHLDPIRRTYRTYPSGAEALEDLAGFPLPTDFLGQLLLGEPFLRSYLNCPEVEGGRPGGESPCPASKSGISAVFAPDRHAVEARFDTGRRFGIHWRDYREASPPPPGRVRIEESASARSLELVIRELHPEDPPSDLFTLIPPAGFRLETGAPPPTLLESGP